MPDEGLYHPDGNALLTMWVMKGVPKIREPQAREACLVSEAVPCGIPVLLTLVWIVSALAFVLAVSNSRKVLGLQVVLRLFGRRL